MATFTPHNGYIEVEDIDTKLANCIRNRAKNNLYVERVVPEKSDVTWPGDVKLKIHLRIYLKDAADPQAIIDDLKKCL